MHLLLSIMSPAVVTGRVSPNHSSGLYRNRAELLLVPVIFIFIFLNWVPSKINTCKNVHSTPVSFSVHHQKKSTRLLHLPDVSLATSAFLRVASKWASGRVGALSGPQSISYCFRDQFGRSSWRCFTPTTTMRASRRPARTRGSVQPGLPVSRGSPGDLPRCRRSEKRRRTFCSWTLETSFRGQFGLITTKAQRPRILWTN